jgi:hypothetical protein
MIEERKSSEATMMEEFARKLEEEKLSNTKLRLSEQNQFQSELRKVEQQR